MTNYFDLETSPLLLKSREQYSRSVLLPVVFFNKNLAFIMLINHPSETVKQFDQWAAQAFRQLQNAASSVMFIPTNCL